MARWMLAVALVGVAGVALAQDAPAKKKPITLDVMLSGKLGGLSGGRRGGGQPVLDWSADGLKYRSVKDGKPVLVDAATGATEELPAADGFAKSLVAAGVDADAAKKLTAPPLRSVTPDGKVALVADGTKRYAAYADGRPARRFPVGAKPEYLALSPSGRFVGSVAGGNLHVTAAGAVEPIHLTADGGGDILNGRADWVYEEEIFNRNGKAYWWSDAGDKIAWMRFDDKPVPKFPLTGMLKPRADLEMENYPKSGDKNPLVTLHVADLSGDKPATHMLNLGNIDPADLVISRVGFMRGVPFAYVQNRTQTHLDFLTWPDLAGKPIKLFRVTTKAWVEDLGAPVVLADGSFLVQNERTGWKHVYRYAADGSELNAVTKGEWEAQTIERIDEAEGCVYVTGTRDGHNRTHLYRVKLDGSGEPERLTPAGFSHSVKLAPAGPYFVSTYSNITTPPATALFKIGDDKPVRILNETALPKSNSDYTFGKVERVQVPLKDGFVLEGILTYPPDFDPSKKYPLWVLTYAGPHAPTVKDAWAGRIKEQVIANAGVVAFNIDPRAASGKGVVSAWTAYRQLGVQELRDLEEAVKWVGAKGWLDDTRVGLQGHSYGGYITAYALTHSKVFSAGISGAPVTDWNLYDTIYTERYMGLPKENPEGYAKSSVVKAARNLHGKLLLIHGMIDDNVHLQNTAQLMAALQDANKDFEVMFYPGSRHGIAGGTHYQRLMADFLFRSMGVTPRTESARGAAAGR